VKKTLGLDIGCTLLLEQNVLKSYALASTNHNVICGPYPESQWVVLQWRSTGKWEGSASGDNAPWSAGLEGASAYFLQSFIMGG